MAKIVWLASYPKSGNTWLRFMIANLVAGKVSSSSEVMRQVPDVHEGINGQHLFGNHTVIVKTHWKYWSGIPLREDVIGAIYIIRHPFQRSGALREATNAAEMGRAAEKWADEYIRHGGCPRFRQYGIGTWEENVRSWLWSGLSVPRLLVHYEDLLADPVAGLSKVARFLGSAKSGDDIPLAVQRSSRACMREIEEREIAERLEGFFYHARNSSGLAAGHRFVGRSANGEDLFRLTQVQRDTALSRFASIMKEFGYTGASARKDLAGDVQRDAALGAVLHLVHGAVGQRDQVGGAELAARPQQRDADGKPDLGFRAPAECCRLAAAAARSALRRCTSAASTSPVQTAHDNDEFIGLRPSKGR